MNDKLNQIVYNDLTNGSMGDITISTSTVANSVFSAPNKIEDVMTEYELNRVTAVYALSTMELMKLKEVSPDFADEVKTTIAKNISQEVARKITYTKKHNVDSDSHQYIGRVWVFTDHDLKDLLARVGYV